MAKGNIREKGKIARGEWPKILSRYTAGETIAQIGRDYGCTAPAIRYIIKRIGNLKDQASATPSASSSVPAAKVPRRRTATEAVSEAAATPGVAAAARRGNLEITSELRKRVSGDIASFLVALDQAALGLSDEAAASLQDAADRLMRSTARVRMELERFADLRAARGASRVSVLGASRSQTP